MKLSLKLMSILLGTCILAGPTASAMMEEDSSDRTCAAPTAEDIDSKISTAFRSLVFPPRGTPSDARIDRFYNIGTVSQEPNSNQPDKEKELEIKYGPYEFYFSMNATLVYNLPPDPMGRGKLSAIATHTPRNLDDLVRLSELTTLSQWCWHTNVIIVIGEVDGENVCDYWNPDVEKRTINPLIPESGLRQLVHYAPSSSKHVGGGPGYEIYDVQFNQYIANKPVTGGKSGAQNLRLYHFRDWKHGKNKPENEDHFYNFVRTIIADSNDGGKDLNAVVQCHGGTSRTGIFLAYLKALRDDNLSGSTTADEAIAHAREIFFNLLQRRTFMFKPEQFDMFCKMLLKHFRLI